MVSVLIIDQQIKQWDEVVVISLILSGLKLHIFQTSNDGVCFNVTGGGMNDYDKYCVIILFDKYVCWLLNTYIHPVDWLRCLDYPCSIPLMISTPYSLIQIKRGVLGRICRFCQQLHV